MFRILSSILSNKSILVPTHQIKSVGDMTRIKGLIDNHQTFIFDKDDTLVPLHEFTVLDPGILKTLSLLREKNKNVLVVSNSVKTSGRTVTFQSENGC